MQDPILWFLKTKITGRIVTREHSKLETKLIAVRKQIIDKRTGIIDMNGPLLVLLETRQRNSMGEIKILFDIFIKIGYGQTIVIFDIGRAHGFKGNNHIILDIF